MNILYNIGIDVGLEGALSIFNSEHDLLEIIKMPIIKLTEGAYKRWYAVNELINIFNKYTPANVLIEYQRPMQGTRNNINI